MTRKKTRARRTPHDLPQGNDSWTVAVRLLRIWITPEDEEPQRPYTSVIIDLERHIVYSGDVAPEYPQAQEILEMLFRAMLKPERSTRQKPHRPAEISFVDAALAEALAPELELLGIRVNHNPPLEEIDEFFDEMEEHMRGRPEPPGLLSMEGATPESVGGFFAAAAAFYRAAPWVHLSDEHTFAITVPPEKTPRFSKLMGNAGMEYGLTMYRRWEDVERMYRHVDSPFELLPEDGGNSVFFEEIVAVPFDDLEAIEQHGWEVADPRAYPMPFVFTRDGEARRPDHADVLWYEAVLWALPVFVKDHLREIKPDEFQPAEANIDVSTHVGKVTVHIKYPAGTIPADMRPVDMMDWAELDEEDDEGIVLPDRRSMEGALARMASDLEGAEIGEAQELMYQAWEETNPAKRIILAHEALSASPDCADAYELLAEEEAGTRARALEYYQKGVEAGERALGQEYFEEKEGHFWGLLETRPYMRARQGLAQLLWDMGRKEEAIAHCRDILRLNPGDNQGVRYMLLNLLVGLNRDDEAQALLAEYEDDAMAEWLYTRALLAFRAEGASQAATQALRAALQQNRHVPAYLTGRKRIPNRLPDYMGWGDDKEAVHYAHGHLAHWRRTSGALAWLQEHVKPRQTAPKKARKGKRGKRRRRK